MTNQSHAELGAASIPPTPGKLASLRAYLPGGWVLLLYAAVLLAGLVCAFRPTLSSGGARIQSDPGDTLLNHYILEHSWLWLTKPGYAATLWSPLCYYPTRLTLAYSENLFGTAPLYWLLRLGLDPVRAYAAWMMLVCSLTYGTTAWVLRRFGLVHPSCAFGAFLFAFGLLRVAQMSHQQLLPHLFAPLAVYFAWRMVMHPRSRTLAGFLAAGFLQVLSSYYLGWFLHLGLLVFIPWLLITHRSRWPGLIAFARRSWLPALGLLAVWGLLFFVSFRVYHKANRGFVRTWEECVGFMPSARDWVMPPPGGIHDTLLGSSSRNYNFERWCFPGWVVLGLAALGLGLAVSRSRLLSGERSRLVLALLGAAASLALLSLRDVHGGYLWKFVYHGVPGAAAVRVVGRIGLMVQLFALTGGLIALDALIRARGPGWRVGHVLAGLVLLVGGLEQVTPVLPSFEAASFYPRAEALGKELTRGTAAYVYPDSTMPFFTSELMAMWAGLHANRPVVNGYSGRTPPGYPGWTLPPKAVMGWLDLSTRDHHWEGRLLYVAPDPKGVDAYRTILLEAGGEPVPSTAQSRRER